MRYLAEALRTETQALKNVIEEQVNTTRDQAKSESEKHERAAEKIARAIHAIKPTDHEKRDDNSYKEKNHRIQKILAFVTFLAFLAAAVAAGGAIYYAGIAKEQLVQMTNANQATRCATLVSAQSAAESAYYSREEERAWVEPLYPNASSLTISNPGKTVGREVRVFVRTAAGESKFGPLTISPYTSLPAPFKFPVRILPNQRLRGEITYVDVFGVSHWTKFCYAFGEKGEMNPCQSGNEEDHNLENPPDSTIPANCRQ